MKFFLPKKWQREKWWWLNSVLFSAHGKNWHEQKTKSTLYFTIDEGDNANFAAENVNSVCGADTVTVNLAQFRFCQFRFDDLVVKDNSRRGSWALLGASFLLLVLLFTVFRGAAHSRWFHANPNKHTTNPSRASIPAWGPLVLAPCLSTATVYVWPF